MGLIPKITAAAAVAGLVVAAYLGLGSDGAPSPAIIATGKKLYAGHCASCHGANLEGQPNWRRPNPDGTFPAPPHDASGHTWHHPDQLLLAYIKKGGAAVAPAGFKSAMPGFDGVMTDGEISAVLTFIKSSWPKEIQERQRGMSR